MMKKQKTEEPSKVIIRDFLYLDAELLASYFSQVFKGFTERVIEATSGGMTSSEAAKGPPFTGSQIETEVVSASLRNESRVLHDHMYSMLEEELRDVVVDIGVNLGEERSIVTEAFLVRASGPARIDDFSRLLHILKNYDKYCECLYLIRTQTPEAALEVAVAEELVKKATGQDKAIAQKLLKDLKDPMVQRKKMGLWADQKYLNSLSFMIEGFRAETLEMTISPLGSEFGGRAILDKKWLRVEPDYLRQLYGGVSCFDFVVLGQVTAISNSAPQPETEIDPTSIHDSMQRMFRAYADLERTFSSGSIPEVMIRPLAIYRQTAIPGDYSWHQLVKVKPCRTS